MKRHLLAVILVAGTACFAVLPVQAQYDKPAAASGHLAEGEIRKVDRDAKKITIRHGPIPSLEMPAMTMVFQVKDPALLEQVKTGDKVRFAAEKAGGAYFVTKVEAAK